MACGFTGTQSGSSIYILSVAAFMTKQQSWVVVTVLCDLQSLKYLFLHKRLLTPGLEGRRKSRRNQLVNERVIGDQLPMRMPLVGVVTALPASSSFCECYIDWEKKDARSLSWELYFIQWTKLRTSSLGCSISDSPEKLFQRGKEEGRIHGSFCIKDQVVGTLEQA